MFLGRYIPGLSKQLISVSQLDREGHHTSFVNNSWKVAKDSRVVARAKNTGTLYLISHEELNTLREEFSDSSL